MVRPTPFALFSLTLLCTGCKTTCPTIGELSAPQRAVYVVDSAFPVQFAIPDSVTLEYDGCSECSGGKGIYWYGSSELCWNAAPSFGLNIQRNDTMTARTCKAWTRMDSQVYCDPSTIDLFRKYDCVDETIDECLSGNSWYRLSHFSYNIPSEGLGSGFRNGYRVDIFRDGLVVSGTLIYHCSEPVDLSAKEQWILSWLRSIRVLSDVEWKEALRNPGR